MKSGNLNFLEPSGPHQACNGTALSFTFIFTRRSDISYLNVEIKFVCFSRDSPQWARASSFTRFLDNTQRRNAVGRTPLDELSARRRDLYLTTHNSHNRQTSMPPVGFEATILADKRPKTYALDRAATGTGRNTTTSLYFKKTQKYNWAIGWFEQWT
jgi:hypothetical protein